jgi:hypothetical protein
VDVEDLSICEGDWAITQVHNTTIVHASLIGDCCVTSGWRLEDKVLTVRAGVRKLFRIVIADECAASDSEVAEMVEFGDYPLSPLAAGPAHGEEGFFACIVEDEVDDVRIAEIIDGLHVRAG